MAGPVKGQEYIHNLPGLSDVGDPQFFKVDPTFATGDWKVRRDNGAFGNLTTLPVVDPAGTSNIKITISALEMTADQVVILAHDVNGEQWSDWGMTINLDTNSTDNIMDLLEGDHEENAAKLKIFKKGTATVLMEKNITGSLLDPTVTINTKEA